MPAIPLRYRDDSGCSSPERGPAFNRLLREDFNAFGPAVLGLGDLARDGAYVQALAAFFDLEGFTDFCSQVDSHLVIPEFLSRYLNWLFRGLAEEFRESEDASHAGSGAPFRSMRSFSATASSSSGRRTDAADCPARSTSRRACWLSRTPMPDSSCRRSVGR
jgi:hypothetical protein